MIPGNSLTDNWTFWQLYQFVIQRSFGIISLCLRIGLRARRNWHSRSGGLCTRYLSALSTGAAAVDLLQQQLLLLRPPHCFRGSNENYVTIKDDIGYTVDTYSKKGMTPAGVPQ